MIQFKTGALFDEKAQALVNTVNCHGVMGKGVALEFKKKYRENYEDYREACKANKVEPGRMYTHECDPSLFDENPRYIINFPTKRHWRHPSRIEDIKSGLEDLAKQIRERKIQSIAIPALGCGNGGLDWAEVSELIKDALQDIEECKIFVFEPGGNSGEK